VLLDRDGWLAGRTTAGTVALSFAGGTQGGVKDVVSGMPEFVPGESAFFMMNRGDLRNNAMSPLVERVRGAVPDPAGEWGVEGVFAGRVRGSDAAGGLQVFLRSSGMPR